MNSTEKWRGVQAEGRAMSEMGCERSYKLWGATGAISFGVNEAEQFFKRCPGSRYHVRQSGNLQFSLILTDN